MSVAEYFRDLAGRCRGLSKTAAEAEVIEQSEFGPSTSQTRPTRRSGVKGKREWLAEGGQDGWHRSRSA